ncbi:hypothetical protein CF120_08765 [Aeromonas allosaccharophila]|nr:hypothetical protein CF120_08765 [Aeromonas allosaccharophila]
MTKGLLKQKALLCATGFTMTTMGDGAVASFIYSHVTSLFRVRRDVFAATTGEHGHLAVVPDTLRTEPEIHLEDS